MTKQTWTALCAALLVVACAAGLALIPVPFVAWTPGVTSNLLSEQDGKPVIAIAGDETFPTDGSLSLTTVSGTSASSSIGLPEALLAYWLPDRVTLPRDWVYPPGRSAAEAREEQVQLMANSQGEAIVAGLRAAGKKIVERPQVKAVVMNGPAKDKLQAGDFILAVDGQAVSQPEEAINAIRAKKIGQIVAVEVLRDNQRVPVEVTTAKSTTEPEVPVIGVSIGPGYQYQQKVTFRIDPDIGGPSAGLIFALAIYDKLTPGALLGNRSVAGTGTIDEEGKVGPIGGLEQKVAGARATGARVFLMPKANCADFQPDLQSGDIKLFAIETLDQAITTLNRLRDGSPVPSPGCG